MILSDSTIEELISRNMLCASSLTRDSIQPASLDITLGKSFAKLLPNQTIELDKPAEYYNWESDSVCIAPHQFILATTNEYFNLPNDITAFVEGRSSIGRLGIFIQNAGWVDAGFSGQITLELYNASESTVILRAGQRVGQLVFAKMDKPCDKSYTGKYQGQVGATGSKIYKDWQK